MKSFVGGAAGNAKIERPRDEETRGLQSGPKSTTSHPASGTITLMNYLKDLWDDQVAEPLADDALELLRYRSNLLGADLRITNFGGGNTSSKLELRDPFTGETVKVLAVKGSGGDLGSIKKSGFALLYLGRLNQLQSVYRGEQYEDEMVSFYPICAFGESKAPASIDTPLHAFLPFAHVDHLHPDWAIALAASANGKAKLAEFNKRYNHNIVWLPWQRPGFELGMMLNRAVRKTRKPMASYSAATASSLGAARSASRMPTASKSSTIWASL